MAVEPVEIVLQGVDNASGTIDKVTQKLVSNEEKYISKLKEQLIAQTEGAVAAERFKLAQMGFSEATIEAAAALKQEIEAAKEAEKAQEELEKKKKEQLDTAKKKFNDIKGLYSEAAGLGVQIGEGINEWILGASAFRMQMERINAENKKMAEGVMGMQQKRLAQVHCPHWVRQGKPAERAGDRGPAAGRAGHPAGAGPANSRHQRRACQGNRTATKKAANRT
jgi:hypothetical protein